MFGLAALNMLAQIPGGYQDAQQKALIAQLERMKLQQAQYDYGAKQQSDALMQSIMPQIIQGVGGLQGLSEGPQAGGPQQTPQMPPQQSPMGGPAGQMPAPVAPQIPSGQPPMAGAAPGAASFVPGRGDMYRPGVTSLGNPQGTRPGFGQTFEDAYGPQTRNVSQYPALADAAGGRAAALGMPNQAQIPAGGPPPGPMRPAPQPQPQPQQAPQPQGGMGQPRGGFDWQGAFAAIQAQNASPAAKVATMERLIHLIHPLQQDEARMAINGLRMEKMISDLELRRMQAGEGDVQTALSRMGWTPQAIDNAARKKMLTGEEPKNLGTRQYAGIISGAINQRLAEIMQEENVTAEQQVQKQAQYQGEKSYQRRAGTSAANIETYANAIKGAIPQAVEASRNLPRGTWVPFNRLWQLQEKYSSDPKYSDFMAANFALFNFYLKAMNPNGNPTVASRLETHFVGLLDMATDQKSYETQVKRIWKEVQMEKGAVVETGKGRKAGEEKYPVPDEDPGLSGKTDTGVPWSVK